MPATGMARSRDEIYFDSVVPGDATRRDPTTKVMMYLLYIYKQ